MLTTDGRRRAATEAKSIGPVAAPLGGSGVATAGDVRTGGANSEAGVRESDARDAEPA
jgi:hypothetical protein